MNTTPQETSTYAGFWLRLVRYLIDSLLVIPLVFVACYVLGVPTLIDLASLQPGAEALQGMSTSFYVGIVVSILVFVVPESSKWQASVEKKVLGFIITDDNGDRAGFVKLLFRFAIKFAAMIFFPLAFLVVVFNKRKKGLHDYIAGTQVIRKS